MKEKSGLETRPYIAKERYTPRWIMAKPIFPITYKPLTRHSAELRAQILALLKKRKSQNQIARELGISLGTVGYHVRRVREAGIYKG